MEWSYILLVIDIFCEEDSVLSVTRKFFSPCAGNIEHTANKLTYRKWKRGLDSP